MSASRLSPAALEKLFLDKLTEKYTLNIRNLKKAFLCYDHDKNGLLDLNELERFISSYCNGIHADDVKVLVNKYDRNNDGYISYEELLEFLTSRNATKGVNGMTTVPVVGSDNHVFRGAIGKNERNEKSKLLKEQYKRNETDLKISKAIDEISTEVKSRPKYGAARRSKQDDASETSSNRSLIISSSKPTVAKAIPANSPRAISPPPMSEISSTITSSDVQSTLDPLNPKHLEYRCKIAVQNLRAVLLKMAADMRASGKIQNRLSMTTPVLLETVACKILLKEFKTFPNILLEKVNGKESILGLPYDSFVELLNNFKAPGSGPVRNEISEFLFELCIQDNSLDPPVANPYQLITLLFGKIPNTVVDGLQRLKLEQPDSPTRAGVSKGRKEPPPVGLQPTTHNGVYIYGSSGGGNKHTEVTGKNDIKKGSLASQMDQGRKLVAAGPFKDPLSDSYETTRVDAIMAVPLRFISRKSKTALVCPTNFDVALLKRSAVLPSYSARIDHVFGMSVSITSGNMIHALPNSGTGALVYAAAGLGVVHDIDTNTQKIYNGHNDDITCIAISGDGRLAGTGCCGKKGDSERDLLIHVWDLSASSNAPLITLGKGFFDRFISAVAFSFDGKYISGISGDDAHTMGIWHIETGQLVTSTTVQKGLAPQVKCMTWSSEQQYTEYITSANSGLCDLVLTTGEHHIKLWSFRRPVSTGMELGGLKEASVQYKELSLNKLTKSGHKPPKVSTCGAFITCSDKTDDVVVGGSNGCVYLFKKGELTTHVAAIKGGVFTLQVMNDKVICGGSQGVVKLLDGRTLNILVSYSLSGSVEIPRGGSVISDTDEQYSSDINSNSHDILGVALFNGGGRGSSSVIKAYVATANGKMVRLDFNSTSVTKSNIFNYYHVGPVTAVCTESSRGGRLIATGGDDRRLCIWDVISRSLLARCNTKGGVRSCHFDRNSAFIAVGSADGSISIFSLSNGKEYSLNEVCYRKDSKEVISDVKFSPNNEYLAAGSHDSHIYVYNCALDTSANIKALYKLKGHSAYITHVDWSIDSLLIQSTCGAYELLYWDIRCGTLLKGEFNTSDIKWKTNHCILGFNVMGMWRPYSDGTDINAIDVHKEKGLMATADDFGKLNILNYPSVVKSAPCRAYNGHTSHVSNVRFLDRRDGNTIIATVGGRDCSVVIWNIDEVIVEKSRTSKDYNNKL